MTEQELSRAPETDLSGIAKVQASRPTMTRAEAEAAFGKDAVVDDPADSSGKKWVCRLDKRKDKDAINKYREMTQPWRREAIDRGFEAHESVPRVTLVTQRGDQREVRAELEDHLSESSGLRRPGKILPANFDAVEARRKRLAQVHQRPPGLFIADDDSGKAWRWASCETIQAALAMEA